jgi:ABC-type multidrug transport system fused ATPase/permease subunit
VNDSLKKSLAILGHDGYKRPFYVLVLLVGVALLDTAGIASVLPFLAVVSDPTILNSNILLNRIYIFTKNFGFDTPDRFIVLLGSGVFFIILFSALFRSFVQYATNKYVEMRRHSIGCSLLTSYLRRSYTFFLSKNSAEMSSIILSEVDQLVGNVLRPIFSMAASGFVLLAIVCLLIYVDPKLALVVVGAFGICYGAVYYHLRLKLSSLGEIRVNSNRARFESASVVFGGLKEIKLFGREQCYVSRFSEASNQFSRTIAKQHTFTQVPKYLIEAVGFGGIISLVLILLIGTGGVASKNLSGVIPLVGLYAFAAYRLQPAIQTIYQGLSSLRYGKSSIQAVYSDLFSSTVGKEKNWEDSRKLIPKSTISVVGVGFQYPGSKHWAISGLSFQVPVGGSIGIVGDSGAGKTTLLDLLLGLLSPTEGHISVDGDRLNEDMLRRWKNCLGYVPQEIFLSDATISENIAFGIPEDQINLDQVQRCSRLARASDFISELPDGYQTVVGERGVRMSGGQRQRIGIARALYHQPEVLILDEATSALDVFTEASVMEAVEGLFGQKTVILVTHRVSTASRCDKIILMRDGRAEAVGTFEDLLEKNSYFRLMAEKSGHAVP